MKFLYETIVFGLLFYFFLNLFSGIRIAGANNSVLLNIAAGLLFGVLIASIPALLKFFKLPVNNGGVFLMALVLIFIFLFILQQGFFDLGDIRRTTINLRPLVRQTLTFGSIQTMVLATVVISLSVLGLKSLQKSK